MVQFIFQMVVGGGGVRFSVFQSVVASLLFDISSLLFSGWHFQNYEHLSRAVGGRYCNRGVRRKYDRYTHSRTGYTHRHTPIGYTQNIDMCTYTRVHVHVRYT